MQPHGNHSKFGEMLLQHVIVFLICVVFPGLVTLTVPSSWLTFERSGDIVSCTTRTCVFFVVPFKVQRVDQVTGIEHRERAGQTRRQREHGRETNKYVEVDGEGFLQILGANDQKAEVSVSPASLEAVVAKANEFLSSTKQETTTIFVIANWKFGALMGGVLTLFTVLYVVGYTLSLLNMIRIGLKRLFNPRPTSTDA